MIKGKKTLKRKRRKEKEKENYTLCRKKNLILVLEPGFHEFG